MATSETVWIDPSVQLPKNTNTYAPDVVLVWVGDNRVSSREVTTAYYDHRNAYWEFIEPRFGGLPVRRWSPLPTPPVLDEEEEEGDEDDS